MLDASSEDGHGPLLMGPINVLPAQFLAQKKRGLTAPIQFVVLESLVLHFFLNSFNSAVNLLASSINSVSCGVHSVLCSVNSFSSSISCGCGSSFCISSSFVHHFLCGIGSFISAVFHRLRGAAGASHEKCRHGGEHCELLDHFSLRFGGESCRKCNHSYHIRKR